VFVRLIRDTNLLKVPELVRFVVGILSAKSIGNITFSTIVKSGEERIGIQD
jgi:hypothetical protein